MKRIRQAISSAMWSGATPEQIEYRDANRALSRAGRAAGDAETEELRAARARLGVAYDRYEASR